MKAKQLGPGSVGWVGWVGCTTFQRSFAVHDMLHACCCVFCSYKCCSTFNYVQDQSRVSQWKHAERCHKVYERIWKEDIYIYDIYDMSHGIPWHPMARYKLLYTFRAHLSDDNSYNCVYQKQDGAGNSWDLSQLQTSAADGYWWIQKPSRLSSPSSRPEVVLLCQRTARIVGDVRISVLIETVEMLQS